MNRAANGLNLAPASHVSTTFHGWTCIFHQQFFRADVMKSRTAQLVGIACCTVALVLALVLAPAEAVWWQKALAVVFAVTFGQRVASIATGGGGPFTGSQQLWRHLSAIPLLLLAVAAYGLPQVWAFVLAAVAWGWSYSTRKYWQP